MSDMPATSEASEPTPGPAQTTKPEPGLDQEFILEQMKLELSIGGRRPEESALALLALRGPKREKLLWTRAEVFQLFRRQQELIGGSGG